MFNRKFAGRVALGMFIATCWAGTGLAQAPCPTGTVLTATCSVAPNASGTITIAPNGLGDTFTGAGLAVTVCIDCSGTPLVGQLAATITVDAPGVVFCPGGNTADTGTGTTGCATFTGSLCGGGCAPALDIYASGTYLCTVPVGINSPDNGTSSPLFVDAGDLAAFAARLGNPAAYSICYDFNESGGPTIDASDLAYFAQFLGAACFGTCP